MDYTFLSDNYVWIIVIAVIVVMTIIGYIADKTKFGEKQEKLKKTKAVPEVETNQESITEDSQMDDFMTEESQMDDFTAEEPFEQEVTSDNDMDTNTEISSESNDEMSFESFEPVAPLPEEISEEPMDFEMPVETKPVQEEEMAEETSENPVTEADEESNDISAEDNTNQEEMVTEDFGLPSIDTLNQEIAEVEEDEDVWKF